jgi:hypothetical protein
LILRLILLGIIPAVAVAGSAYVPGAAVRSALQEGGITGNESIEQRINKSLHLLNDQGYFQPRGQPGSSPGYELDSTRTADQILKEKQGGGCGSASLALAAMLIASGVPEEKVRIVGAVVNEELIRVCPTDGRVVRKEQTPLGLSGHVFVLVDVGNGDWRLVNSTDSSKNPDIIKYISPDDLSKKMERGPVQIPPRAYKNMSAIPGPDKTFASGMTVFASWKILEYPQHRFSDRFNLVASGNIKNEACRYGAKEISAERARVIKSVARGAAEIAPGTQSAEPAL